MNTPSLGFLKTALLAAGICILNCAPMSAQTGTAPLSDQLREISAVMQQEGNDHFVIVETFSDGLLKPGYAFDFSFSERGIVLNGVAMQGAMKEKYDLMMRSYFKVPEGKPLHGTSFSLSTGGDVINADSILNPNSSVRRNRSAEFRAMMNKPQVDYDPLLLEMVQDGIFTKKDHITLLYNKDGLLVNEKKLPPALDKKYKELFAVKYHMAPDKKEESLRLSQGPLDKN